MLFQILAFLISPLGFVVFGFGIALFLLAPFAPKILGVGKSLARLHIWLGLWAAGRCAIVVSEHGDLLFKRMTFDDRGVEKIDLDETTKEFEDPSTALHHWKGTAFALADEVHGVLFDPRGAAMGERKREYDERDLGPVKASESDWSTWGIDEWVPGVFEMPTNHEIVELSSIRRIIDGGERSEYPERVEEIYKLSRNPLSNNTELLRSMVPLISFLATIILWWQIGEDASLPTSTISFGSLIFIASVQQSVRDIDWGYVGRVAALAVPLPLLYLVSAVTLGPVFATVIFVVMGMGFWFLPVLTFLTAWSGRISGGLSRRVYLKLGLLGFDRPMLEWTRNGYKLREGDRLDTEGEPTWYGFLGSTIGFSYAPEKESWGPEVVERETLESSADGLVADGGSETEIPAGYRRCPHLRKGIYGGYIPNRLTDGKIYLHSGNALSKITDAAVGEKSLRRLLRAKEVHGDGTGGMSNRTLMIATMASIGFGSILGVLLFVA